MVLHTFNTWLLANVIHPLIWILCAFVFFPAVINEFHPDTLLRECVIIFIFSLLVSSPLFVLGCIFIRIVTQPRYTIPAAWSLWLATLILLIVFEAIVMMFFFDSAFFGMYQLFLPSIIATCLAVCIRYRQFTRLYYSPET
ncbi:MAG TPA: hypothetical protein VK644_11270, partial [Chitinophagaceae bacterium]|nr:hypothetical protein [Chitinophagaceae bacterium]